jgi:hypothetical protein
MAAEAQPESNGVKAYVFFGDRCADAFTQDPTHAHIFAGPADSPVRPTSCGWRRCAPLHVDVVLEPS